MILSLYFVLWLTLKKLQSVTETKYWHTIFSQLFSFTLRYKLCFKWILSKPSVFTCFVCIWSFGRARSSVYFACLFWSVPRRHTHTHTHARARANTHAHTLQPEEQRLSCGLYFQRFIIKHVQQFSNCKDGILQQSTDDWSDSDVKFWSERNECAPLWREGSCARRNTAIIFRS